MNIEIPSILRGHQRELKQFFEGMVFKLAVNAYKDKISERDIPILIDRMLDELAEFKDEFKDGDKPGSNALMETFDGANFWYLMFSYLRNTGVPDAQEMFIAEFFEVDADKGKVYAAKNRSGSRYRAGDEIKGVERGGRVYIRAQHSLTGASVSLPRAAIVWYSEYALWPHGEITYRDGDRSNDAIKNLEIREEEPNGSEFPFVVQWKPKGKENSTHFGKWCYQRRHNLILVKTGYYDSPEEAAKQGLLDWKSRVSKMENDNA